MDASWGRLFRWWLRGLVLVALASAAASRPALPLRPNILYILADDLGVGDLSCLNARCAWRTPHLDRLAQGGRIFTDAHSASGVCTPSRYTLLTGRYSWRGALKSGVLYGYDPALIEPGRPTVPSFLREHGYVTAMIGKWHLGLDWAKTGPQPEAVDYLRPFGGGPSAHGFDRFYGLAASLDMPPYVYLVNDRVSALPTNHVAASPAPKLWRAGAISSDFQHAEVQQRFTDRAIEYLTEQRAGAGSKPFFLYLAFASPHTPIVPTGSFDGQTHTNPYGDYVTQLDADVGRILGALEKLQLATNTLVIFTADNGCSPAANLDQLRTFNHDPSAGYRGHKADLFEGGHRIPFLARWPGQIPAGTRCAQTIGQGDLLATCAELLATPMPVGAGEDSVSLLPLLRGGEHVPRGRAGLVHHSINGSFAIRDGRWKLLLAPDSGGWSAPHPGTKETNGLPRVQLYDLVADPGEQRNQQAAHPEIVRRLGHQLRELVERGRSTPGPSVAVDRSKPWPQIEVLREY